MQTILKSNASSFILNIYFSRINNKKVTLSGGGGKWGNLPNLLLKVEILVSTNAWRTVRCESVKR